MRLHLRRELSDWLDASDGSFAGGRRPKHAPKPVGGWCVGEIMTATPRKWRSSGLRCSHAATGHTVFAVIALLAGRTRGLASGANRRSDAIGVGTAPDAVFALVATI